MGCAQLLGIHLHKTIESDGVFGVAVLKQIFNTNIDMDTLKIEELLRDNMAQS